MQQTYFVHSPKLEAIKIGRSVKPMGRVKDFGTANPDKLALLGVIEGDHESEFHQQFAAYRIDKKREWFSLGAELMDFIKSQFGCVLKQKNRTAGRLPMIESWDAIVDRAEALFKHGLRHADYDDFCEVMRDRIHDRVGQEWGEDDGLDDEKGFNDEQYQEFCEETAPGDEIVDRLEKWWPWVMGWNVKAGNWLDVFLLFKRPDQARMRADLLYELARWGDLSDYDSVEFIRLNVAFCYRRRLGGEITGEIEGPVIITDEVALLCRNADLVTIGIDELFGFKILGDTWYRQNNLPVPAEAKAMSPEQAKPSAKKLRRLLQHNQIPLFPLTQP